MSEREKYRTLGTYYSAFVHNYPQAIETYERLVFLFPGDAAAYNNLSIAYVFTLNFPKAVAAIRHAIELNPDNPKFHLNYALYSMYAGDFPTAINEARRILQQDPKFEFAYLPLGLSLLARGDVNDARDVYAKLEKVSPETNSIAKTGEADLDMYLGQYRTAIEKLAAGIADDQREKHTGELALKYIAKAEAHLMLGQKNDAISAAQKAVALNPGEESVLYPAARVLVQAGDDAGARKIAQTLANTLQTQSRSWAQLIAGELAMQHKQLPAAVEAFQQAQKLHNSWISHFLLGRAYLEAGHNGEALAEFETCKVRQGETADLMFADTPTLRYLPPLFYWLARAQQGMGMQSAAKENLDRFLAVRGRSDEDPMVREAKRTAAGSSR
jgi:tetratricopeptide (TPR) repeat protein